MFTLNFWEGMTIKTKKSDSQEKKQLIIKELRGFIFQFSCWLVLKAETWIIQTSDFQYGEFLVGRKETKDVSIILQQQEFLWKLSW